MEQNNATTDTTLTEHLSAVYNIDDLEECVSETTETQTETVEYTIRVTADEDNYSELEELRRDLPASGVWSARNGSATESRGGWA